MPLKLASTVIFLGLFGCAEETPPESRVVLEIAGRSVTLGEFDRFIRMSVQQESPVLSSEVMAALFDQFVEEQLLLRAADDAGIRADPGVVAQRMAALRSIPEDSAAAPEPLGRDDQAVAENLEKQVRIETLVSAEALAAVEIDDLEVTAYYESHREEFVRPETVDVSQILVDTEERAQELRKSILARKASFEDVAREESKGPEASRGGNMGAFARGELPPSFDAEVFALDTGALSEVVSTDFGFHLFRVNIRTAEEPLSLDQVREAVRVELLREKSEEAMKRYVAELESRYPLTVHQQNLSFAPALSFAGEDEPMEKTR
ncbi:MAG TPA: peptidyl-prolyl cis-trans isomerase [Vicinamibacteria bacterium]|nr:peptidyl-prolyl cis-trans isomerase [Vicinamibacteria bacterium]